MVDFALSCALVLCTLVVASLYARRVWHTGSAHHPRVDRAGGSVLLSKAAMQMGYWAFGPLARGCIAAGVGASAVSFASLGLGVAAGAAIALGHWGVGAGLSVASSICDALDGMIARATGTASDRGEVLDATVDRYAELCFLGGVAFQERGDGVGLGLALAATAGAVMVSYATAKAEALGVEAPRGTMRRQERAVYLALGAALTPFAVEASASGALPYWTARLPLFGALALVGAVGNVSALRRLYAVARAVQGPQQGFGAHHAPVSKSPRPSDCDRVEGGRATASDVVH